MAKAIEIKKKTKSNNSCIEKKIEADTNTHRTPKIPSKTNKKRKSVNFFRAYTFRIDLKNFTHTHPQNTHYTILAVYAYSMRVAVYFWIEICSYSNKLKLKKAQAHKSC